MIWRCRITVGAHHCKTCAPRSAPAHDNVQRRNNEGYSKKAVVAPTKTRRRSSTALATSTRIMRCAAWMQQKGARPEASTIGRHASRRVDTDFSTTWVYTGCPCRDSGMAGTQWSVHRGTGGPKRTCHGGRGSGGVWGVEAREGSWTRPIG